MKAADGKAYKLIKNAGQAALPGVTTKTKAKIAVVDNHSTTKKSTHPDSAQSRDSNGIASKCLTVSADSAHSRDSNGIASG